MFGNILMNCHFEVDTRVTSVSKAKEKHITEPSTDAKNAQTNDKRKITWSSLKQSK